VPVDAVGAIRTDFVVPVQNAVKSLLLPGPGRLSVRTRLPFLSPFEKA